MERVTGQPEWNVTSDIRTIHLRGGTDKGGPKKTVERVNVDGSVGKGTCNCRRGVGN